MPHRQILYIDGIYGKRNYGGKITEAKDMKRIEVAFRFGHSLTKCAERLYADPVGETYGMRWFGGGYDRTALAVKLRKLKLFYESETVLTCYKSMDPNDLAACEQWQMGDVTCDDDPETITSIYEWPEKRKMTFGQKFLAVKGADHRYTHGEKVSSIIHELSHLVLETQDKVHSRGRWNGKEVYGAESARAYSYEVNQLPLTSAENWGYYIVEYRNNLILADLATGFGPALINGGLRRPTLPLADQCGDAWDMLTEDRVGWRSRKYPL